MRTLKEEEIKNMKGGLSTSGALIIGALATIIAGILDGICRPLGCK